MRIALTCTHTSTYLTPLQAVSAAVANINAITAAATSPEEVQKAGQVAATELVQSVQALVAAVAADPSQLQVRFHCWRNCTVLVHTA